MAASTRYKMGDDTINNDNGLGGQDTGTIEGGGQNPVNTPPDNPPFPDPIPTPTPDPAPTPAESSDGGEDEFLKYVKMANDLHWIPGILKAYGADNQLPFGKVEEEAYEENEETEKLVFPNEYWDKEADADEELDEDTWSPETMDPQVDETLEEEIFNDQPGPEFDADEDLDEEVFGDVYGEAADNADEELDEELFGVEAYAAEAAEAESPLNQGEPEALDEYTFNEPESEEDTFTADYPREVGEGAADDAEKVRDMLKKLLPSEDAEGAIKDPEWTFGKFMKAKFPSYVASDRAAKFLDLVAQYSVVDAVERLAVQEAREEVLAAATGDEDQDELLAVIQEAADAKRKEYLSTYVLPDAEGEPAKYRKFWKDVLEIIKAL